MAKLGNQVKLAWLKSMEAIGKGASSLASNAHLKVTEINLETRRRELLGEFPLRAHDLWQKGVALPDPLGDMMAELNELDEKLSVLRAQRYARVEVAEGGDENGATAAGDTPAAGEETAARATAGLASDGEGADATADSADSVADKAMCAANANEVADENNSDATANAADENNSSTFSNTADAPSTADAADPEPLAEADGADNSNESTDSASESEQTGDNA